MYVDPEDSGSDKEVYSKTKKVSPFSFMSENVLKTIPTSEAPPPTYDRYADIKNKQSSKKDDILHGLVV